MSYKKLQVKYSTMPNKENLILSENIMTYDLNDIFQAMFQPISENEPQNFSGILNNSVYTKFIKCNEIDGKTTISNVSNINNNYNEPLNLVKAKSIEPTRRQPIKRSAESEDDHIQPNLKVRKIMPKVDNEQVIQLLPITENLQNMLKCVNAFADVQKIHTQSITPTNFNAKITNQMKKKSKICLMDENVKRVIDDNSITETDEECWVVLGPNGSKIKRSTLESVDWRKSNSAITRNILKHIFGLDILATHNLSGKKSPAFFEMEMPIKGQLDTLIIADVVHFMEQTLHMTEKEVKMAVTSACADAGKWSKKNTPEKKK